MAQEAAEEFNVTPQEALLGLVRSALARSSWLDGVVRERLRQHVEAGGNPLDPPDEIVRWVRQSREERTAATRTAKAAVDAGVMTALERRLDLEGELVADALGEVLDALGLDSDRRLQALSVAQWALAGREGPRPAAPTEPPVADTDDAQVTRREAQFRELMARDGVDADALLAEEDDDDDDE